MKRKQLQAEIKQALAARGEYRRVVTRKTFWGNNRLAFEVQPHGNSACSGFVYSVSCLPNDCGVNNYDYTVNRNFDSEDKFLNALLRYIKLDN